MSVNHILRTGNSISISLVAAVASTMNWLWAGRRMSVAYCTVMFKNFVGSTLKMHNLNAFLEFFRVVFVFFNLKMKLITYITFKSDNF